MSREVLGAFIDAIYAIALTILALEVPSELEGGFAAAHFGAVLVEYAIAFTILFAFWVQHRRINSFVETYERGGLWLNGLILLLVCIVPRATTLVFEYGGNVTVDTMGQLLDDDGVLDTAELVDLFYVLVVVAADALLFLLMRANLRSCADAPGAGDVRASKTVSTVALLGIVGLSFLLPIENRYFLLAVPVVLFLEREILRLIPRRLVGT